MEMMRNEQREAKFLEQLSVTGLVYTSCENAGFPYQSMLRLTKVDEEFAQRVEEAKLRYCETIEAEIHRRAVDGYDRGIYYEGKLVATEKRHSDALMAMLAKRHIAAYRDKDASVNVSGGVLVVQAPAQSTEEWLESMKRED